MVKQQASSAKRWQRAKNPQTQQGQEREHQESKVHQGDRVVRLEEPDANKYKVKRRRPTIMMPTTKVQSLEISLWWKQNDFLSLLQGFPYKAMMTPPHKSCARLCFQPIPWILTILWAELLETVIGRIANHSSNLNPVDQKHCQPQFWV